MLFYSILFYGIWANRLNNVTERTALEQRNRRKKKAQKKDCSRWLIPGTRKTEGKTIYYNLSRPPEKVKCKDRQQRDAFKKVMT